MQLPIQQNYFAERYIQPPKRYAGLAELDYPFDDNVVNVRTCFKRQKANLSTAFAG